jgi:hypothetical protein
MNDEAKLASSIEKTICELIQFVIAIGPAYYYHCKMEIALLRVSARYLSALQARTIVLLSASAATVAVLSVFDPGQR